MGFVLHILAALAAVAAAELGLGPDSARPVSLALCLALPHVLGFAARRAAIAGRFRTAARLERLLVTSPPVLQWWAVLGAGWVALLRSRFGIGDDLLDWPGPWLFGALAPFVVFEVLALDARARLHASGADVGRMRVLGLRLFASAFLPFAAYVGLSSLVGLHEGLRIHVQEVGMWNAVYTAALLGLFLAFLPAALTSTWDTGPLEPGPLRSMLEEVARRAGFRCRNLYVWHTGNRMVNAAILGFTPGSRRVLFSDALLGQLAPSELAAVFAHEIGHARRHHALVFAAFAVGFLLGADLLAHRLSAEWLVDREDWVFGGLIAGAVLVWYVVFGSLSRRFELEADLESVSILGGHESLVAALQRVTGAHAHERSSWRHFSTADRVRFLLADADDPAVGRRLRARLRRVVVAVAVLAVVVVALQVARLSSTMGEDRIVAALRLGRYERAAALLEDTAEVDPELTTLVEYAATLEPLRPEPTALVEEAFALARDGRYGPARQHIELALLRGRRDLFDVHGVLDALEQGEELPADALEALPQAWRDALVPD